MSESLKNKTFSGSVWSLADNLAGSGITFLVGLVLARLLEPAEYDVLGIIMIFVVVFNSIVDSGFSNALIRKNDATGVDYNTVFFFNLIISVVLFGVLYFSAGVISSYFGKPILVPVTKVMASIVIINAFAIIQRTILVKNIDFKTQTKVSLIASIVSGVVGIAMALKGYGVWSLVGQQVSRQLMNSVFLWVFNRWRPGLTISFKSFKELFGFGWKLLVSGLIDTLWKKSYEFVIGKCYTEGTLGQYTRADQFNMIFSSNLTAVVHRVSYPVLSKIQDEKERLKQAYRKIIKTTMLVTFPCMLGLAAIAEPMVRVLIGDKWLPSVPYLQIICFSGMLYPLHALNLNMLQVKGRSDVYLILEIVKKTIAVGPLLLGIFINIYWMLIGSVFTGFIAYYLNGHYSGREISYPCREQVRDIMPTFLISMAMAATVYAMSFLEISVFIVFPLQLIVGFGMMIGMYELFKLDEYKELKKIVFGYLKGRNDE